MSVARIASALLSADLAVGIAPMLGAVPTSHAAASRTARAQATTSLAGHRWPHRVQVDGKAGRDAVVIIGGKDLTLYSFGTGPGHIRVRARLTNGRRTSSSRQLLSYLSVRSPWTPWLGATNLDHQGGKEMMVGF